MILTSLISYQLNLRDLGKTEVPRSTSELDIAVKDEDLPKFRHLGSIRHREGLTSWVSHIP